MQLSYAEMVLSLVLFLIKEELSPVILKQPIICLTVFSDILKIYSCQPGAYFSVNLMFNLYKGQNNFCNDS